MTESSESDKSYWGVHLMRPDTSCDSKLLKSNEVILPIYAVLHSGTLSVVSVTDRSYDYEIVLW